MMVGSFLLMSLVASPLLLAERCLTARDQSSSFFRSNGLEIPAFATPNSAEGSS